MAFNFSGNIDLHSSEIQNVRLQRLSSDPTGGQALIYYNTSSEVIRYYNGSAWITLGTGTGSGDFSSNTSTSVDGEVVLFSGTTGKTAKRATISGIAKLTSGVLSAGTAGTDYTSPSSTETFTNKTFSATGTGNTLSNIATTNFASNVIDTDVTLAANSDTRLATQKAVKAYADGLLLANDAMVLKGGIDCSGNPNYPAANAGDTYKITVAGKIGGASGVTVTANDTAYCTVDSTSSGNHATVGANWVVVQANVDAATTSTQGLVVLADSTVAEAKSDSAKALTAASVVNFPISKTFTIGDGSTTSFACTHNLGKKNVVFSIRDTGTDEFWLTTTVATSTSVTTFTFTPAPTTNQFVITIIG